MENKKITKFFSLPLMKQNIRSSCVLCIAVLLIMLLLSNVVNYAISLMKTDRVEGDVSAYQEEFFSYLGAFAAFNSMKGTSLSYDDFIERNNDTGYEQAFEMLNKQTDNNFSIDGLEFAVKGLTDAGADMQVYVKAFEYNFALARSEGVFNKEELSAQDCLNTTLAMMGVSSDIVEKMSELDTAAMINRMYYTVMGLLPLFILIVILANNLIAEQVDRGSMAYVLSTPTKRSAVAVTQMLFMIFVPAVIIGLVCLSRIGTTYLFYDEVNIKSIITLFAGMYILIEAVSGICYLSSCFFSQSRKAMGISGGITVWFFIASLLGLFGTDNMVNTGMGVEELSIFNKLTLIGLYDIDNMATVGTSDVCYDFVYKLIILAIVAVTAYTVGAVRFTKKDLPL